MPRLPRRGLRHRPSTIADHDSWQTDHHLWVWLPAAAEQHHTDSNARGTFNFTGLETGYDFSDFLLGLPLSDFRVRYLDNNDARYLRETTLSGFRHRRLPMLSNLTINGGLRWEYFSPVHGKERPNGESRFCARFHSRRAGAAGADRPCSGAFPQGFIKPDYKLFSPRIGIAWKPWKSKQVVVRSGYGIYYNGSVYGQIASRLVGQPPFATTTQLFQSTATPLSLENGFPLIGIRPDRQYLHGG